MGAEHSREYEESLPSVLTTPHETRGQEAPGETSPRITVFSRYERPKYSVLHFDLAEGDNFKVSVGDGCMKGARGWDIDRVLGSGVNGDVYVACSKGGDCSKVLKMLMLGYVNLKDHRKRMGERDAGAFEFCQYTVDRQVDFWLEADTMRMAHSMGAGPAVYDAWTCVVDDISRPSDPVQANMGFILAERWDMTLKEAKEKGYSLPQELVSRLSERLWKIHQSKGIINTDGLRAANIFVRVSSNGHSSNSQVTDMIVGDWGSTDPKDIDIEGQPKTLEDYAATINHSWEHPN